MSNQNSLIRLLWELKRGNKNDINEILSNSVSFKNMNNTKKNKIKKNAEKILDSINLRNTYNNQQSFYMDILQKIDNKAKINAIMKLNKQRKRNNKIKYNKKISNMKETNSTPLNLFQIAENEYNYKENMKTRAENLLEKQRVRYENSQKVRGNINQTKKNLVSNRRKINVELALRKIKINRKTLRKKLEGLTNKLTAKSNSATFGNKRFKGYSDRVKKMLNNFDCLRDSCLIKKTLKFLEEIQPDIQKSVEKKRSGSKKNQQETASKDLAECWDNLYNYLKRFDLEKIKLIEEDIEVEMNEMNEKKKVKNKYNNVMKNLIRKSNNNITGKAAQNAIRLAQKQSLYEAEEPETPPLPENENTKIIINGKDFNHFFNNKNNRTIKENMQSLVKNMSNSSKKKTKAQSYFEKEIARTNNKEELQKLFINMYLTKLRSKKERDKNLGEYNKNQRSCKKTINLQNKINCAKEIKNKYNTRQTAGGKKYIYVKGVGKRLVRKSKSGKKYVIVKKKKKYLK